MRTKGPCPAISSRAAMYVRMSTEHQQYSIVNQSDAIERYAAEHKLKLVKKFIDSGRSGLTLDKRPGLRQLLTEVISTKANFNHVLVYDVSRWGRFQDPDEAAYYDYTCKKANIKLHYCVEQFPNDNTVYGNLIKALKRTMAGEYSRELSVKVHASQIRFAAMGFHQGGNAGYGLRRLLVDPSGKTKGWLQPGQRKNLQTDRVFLVPGPAKETAIVRNIFDLFTTENRSEQEIAGILNRRKIIAERCMCYPDQTQWTRSRVHKILISPKYIGTLVYNRTSNKLGTGTVHNPKDQWIRREAAVKPLIAPDVFAQAQKIMQNRMDFPTNFQILEQLSDLLRRKGKLSTEIIRKDPKTVGISLIYTRFKNMPAVYELLGYKPKWDSPGIATRRQERFRKQGVKSLGEGMRAALTSGQLPMSFTLAELRSACPGWRQETYSCFCRNCITRGDGKGLIKLKRLGYGKYTVVDSVPLQQERFQPQITSAVPVPRRASV